MFFILYVFYKDNKIFAKHLFVCNNPHISSPKMLPFSQSHNHGLGSCWVWVLCCDWALQSRQSRRWSISSVFGCPFKTAEHTIFSIQLYSPSNCVFKSGVECDKKVGEKLKNHLGWCRWGEKIRQKTFAETNHKENMCAHKAWGYGNRPRRCCPYGCKCLKMKNKAPSRGCFFFLAPKISIEPRNEKDKVGRVGRLKQDLYVACICLLLSGGASPERASAIQTSLIALGFLQLLWLVWLWPVAPSLPFAEDSK